MSSDTSMSGNVPGLAPDSREASSSEVLSSIPGVTSGARSELQALLCMPAERCWGCCTPWWPGSARSSVHSKGLAVCEQCLHEQAEAPDMSVGLASDMGEGLSCTGSFASAWPWQAWSLSPARFCWVICK